MDRTADLERRIVELERRNIELERRLVQIEGMMTTRSVAPATASPSPVASPSSSRTGVYTIGSTGLGKDNKMGDWLLWLIKCDPSDPRTVSRGTTGQIKADAYKVKGKDDPRFIELIGYCLNLIGVAPTGTRSDFSEFKTHWAKFFGRVGAQMKNVNSYDSAMNLLKQIATKSVTGSQFSGAFAPVQTSDAEEEKIELVAPTHSPFAPPPSGFGAPPPSGFGAPPPSGFGGMFSSQ